MKYVNNLTNEDIFLFISSVLSNETGLFRGKEPKYKSYNEYLSIYSSDENSISISSNYNCGMSFYNIFTIDDYSFTSIYPTIQKEYTTAWRNFLSRRFTEYKNDLKAYLHNKITAKHK